MAKTTDYARIIGRFNQLKGTKYQFGTSSINKRIDEAIEYKNYNEVNIMDGMQDWENDSIRDYLDCLPILQQEATVDPLLVTPSAIVEQPQQVAQTSLGLLEQAIAQIFVQNKADEIANGVMDKVTGMVRDFIKEEYGTITRKVEFEIGEKKFTPQGITHDKFELVLAFAMANEPVFLCGPAGSGKNVLCKQIAESMGLDFYFSNAVTQEYKITGFTDAMGVFHESQFYKAFKNGGVFMLDEMDASIPEVLIILNSAIANKYFDFPAPIGYVEAHEDFRVVAAGNTYGTGASYQYVGRNQLDMASLDRFAIVKIDYCKAIEEQCAMGNKDLLEFIRDFRKASEKAGINTVTSYRSINRIAKLHKALGITETLRTCLIKGLERDDINMIKSSMNYNPLNEFYEGIEVISNEA